MPPPIMRIATNNRLRSAYSLLELMIALGLLGALMSVAWSLMSTFRDAEQRGWKITRRIQIIRAAHEWLQTDMQHLAGSNSDLEFVGNSLGFSTTIAPSLDPLPFLQRLLSDSTTPSDSDDLTGELAFTNDLVQQEQSPWRDEQLGIEYELLVAVDANIASSVSDQAEDEIQFMLVRRELVASGVLGPAGEQPAGVDLDNELNGMQALAAGQQILTGQDLYRQSEESMRPRGIPRAQMKLEGLVRPQFQYCDGRTWKSQWNSRTAGRLPTAVALRFDFPARSDMRPPAPRAAADSNALAAAPGPDPLNGGGSEFSAADMALASEPRAELDTEGDASLMEAGEFEVQLVVGLPALGSPLPGGAAPNFNQSGANY